MSEAKRERCIVSVSGGKTSMRMAALKKLVRVAQETPEKFEFPARMEREYGTAKVASGTTFFRGNRSAQEILSIAELVNGQRNMFRDYEDEDGGCSESCEPFVKLADLA